MPNRLLLCPLLTRIPAPAYIITINYLLFCRFGFYFYGIHVVRRDDNCNCRLNVVKVRCDFRVLCGVRDSCSFRNTDRPALLWSQSDDVQCNDIELNVFF